MKLLLIFILRVLLSHSFIFFRFYFLPMYMWFYSCLIMQFMYFYCYDYVFSLYVYVWLPCLRFFRAFSSVVRQMPGLNPQRRDTARTLRNFCVVLCIFLCCSMYFLCCSMYFCVVLCVVCFVSFSVLFMCICVLNYCHRVATQLQLNIILNLRSVSRHLVHSISFTRPPGCLKTGTQVPV